MKGVALVMAFLLTCGMWALAIIATVTGPDAEAVDAMSKDERQTVGIILLVLFAAAAFLTYWTYKLITLVITDGKRDSIFD